MTTIVINLIGLVLFLFIIWWFLLAKSKATTIQGNSIDILVKDGVYEPNVLQARQGQTLHLNFLREDTSPCAETVIFDDFGISAKLPIGEKHTISLELKDQGTFEFTCQMQMYRGTLIVE